MHRSHFGQRSTASFLQNHVHETSRRKGRYSGRGWRRRRESPSSYGRESGAGRQQARNGHQKDTKTDGKAWRAQGRCLQRATENERKKRRRWENRAEEVATRYPWTRQTVGPSRIVTIRKTKVQELQRLLDGKNASFQKTFRAQQEANDRVWRTGQQEDGKNPS